MTDDTTNPYCAVLRMDVPRLEAVVGHREANTYGLLIVALLERGAPMTLEEVAERFERAGVAPAERALASLKRCRPARPPVYRDADRYALDPHDGEAEFWTYWLGLRPPAVPPLQVVRAEPDTIPSEDEPPSVGHVDEVLREELPYDLSTRRIVIWVLDAHRAPMLPERVLEFISTRAWWMPLSYRSLSRIGRGGPVLERDDGTWTIDPDDPAVRSARRALAKRLEIVRRKREGRPDPVVAAAATRRRRARSEAHALELARARRVVLWAFPARSPRAVVEVDLATGSIVTHFDEAIAELAGRLDAYDVIAAVEVRTLLRRIGFDPGTRLLADLGPPQKTRSVDGRTVRVTLERLVRGSCRIDRPFGDPATLRRYLEQGRTDRLRRRLEADARSLAALYRYGRLHRGVRLRTVDVDDMIEVPWSHRDEPTLQTSMYDAVQRGVLLEVVLGRAPGWDDPWARASLVQVVPGEVHWEFFLYDSRGRSIDPDDVQAARSSE